MEGVWGTKPYEMLEDDQPYRVHRAALWFLSRGDDPHARRKTAIEALIKGNRGVSVEEATEAVDYWLAHWTYFETRKKEMRKLRGQALKAIIQVEDTQHRATPATAGLCPPPTLS